VFCVGPDWSDGSGGTMAGSQYPSPISTKIRDDVWHTGSEGETRLVKAGLADKMHRIYYPQDEKKRECPKDAAAPCVVTDVVTIAAETWKVQSWNVGGTGGGSIFGLNLGISGGYGQESGQKERQEFTLSNMVPYGIGKTVTPSSFQDWKTRSGTVRGGYFRTGTMCRSGGNFGQQYEYRDEDWATWTAEENVGGGGTWIFDGDKLEKWM
ncbi:MAG TPA: hypothetical protein VI248_21820, partial [Kineosporiaceae bacterium]